LLVGNLLLLGSLLLGCLLGGFLLGCFLLGHASSSVKGFLARAVSKNFKVLEGYERLLAHDTETTSVSRTLAGEINHSLATTANDLSNKELMSSSCTRCGKILQHIFHIIPRFAENFFRVVAR
jgi:hypothetical protein